MCVEPISVETSNDYYRIRISTSFKLVPARLDPFRLHAQLNDELQTEKTNYFWFRIKPNAPFNFSRYKFRFMTREGISNTGAASGRRILSFRHGHAL